jgi:hypothetical protein
MKILKTLLTVLISSTLITGCQTKWTKVLILADYSKFKPTSGEQKTISLSEEELHPTPYELDYNDEDVTITLTTPDSTYQFQTKGYGTYVISLSKDTIVSIPADYASESYITISDLLPHLEKGKDAKTDNIIQSLDSIKQKEEEDKSSKGYSGLKMITFNTIQCISRNQDAKAFAFKSPPEEIKVAQGTYPEYYRLERISYLRELMQ